MPRGDRSERVVAALTSGPARAGEIARKLECTPEQASALLAYLCKKGRVARTGRGLYQLAESRERIEESSTQQLAKGRATESDSIVLPRELPDTGLPQANPYLLREALARIVRFSAAYTGPATDSTVIEATLAAMHLQRALGVQDDELLPRSRGYSDLLQALGEEP